MQQLLLGSPGTNALMVSALQLLAAADLSSLRQCAHRSQVATVHVSACRHGTVEAVVRWLQAAQGAAPAAACKRAATARSLRHATPKTSVHHAHRRPSPPRLLSAGSKEQRRRILLSLRLSRLAAGLAASALAEGACLPGCVTSVEDHGYLLLFGIQVRPAGAACPAPLHLWYA